MVPEVPEEFLGKVARRREEIKKERDQLERLTSTSPAVARPTPGVVRLLAVARHVGLMAARCLNERDQIRLVEEIRIRDAGWLFSAKYREVSVANGWFVASAAAHSYSYEGGNRSESDFGTILHEILLTPTGQLFAYVRNAEHNRQRDRPAPGPVRVLRYAELASDALPPFDKDSPVLTVSAIEAGLIEFCAHYSVLDRA